jgi:UDP-N-acetylglucosamine:LPS N-acetylglucosamine transferase
MPVEARGMTTTPLAPRQDLTPAAPQAPAPFLASASRRVAVVTGSYGAGHDRAAAALAAAFRDAGDEVDVYDVVRLAPAGLGRALRSAYYAQLRRAPRSWDATLRHLEPGMAGHTLVTGALRALTPAVTRAVRWADLVVSTHPFASQALGHARAGGRLDAPVLTYLTDSSVHPLWVHPAVDLHTALHEVAADQARRWGGTTLVVEPAVPPSVGAPAPVPLDVWRGADPARHRRALVTGGSLGIGSLDDSVADVLAVEGWTPVVLCGSNEVLRHRLSGWPGVVPLGWRDDVPTIMRAVDCVVDNAGGFTSLEALASGTPVITYRPLAGHGRANALAMEQAGLAPYVRRRDDLPGALELMAHAPRIDRLPSGGPTVVEAVSLLAPARRRLGSVADRVR